MLVNFLIVQSAPGGPIQQIVAKLRGSGSDVDARFGAGEIDQTFSSNTDQTYRGAQGIDPDFIKKLEKQFGFDKPAHERFLIMIKNYITFDFGKSYFQDQNVIELIKSKLPVSISLGLWSAFIIYLIAIPVGILKAVRDGSTFDLWSSALIIVAYAVPGFLFALFLIVFFAGGSFFSFFPIRGLTSDNWENLTMLGKLKDYLWHITLPVISIVMGGFAKLTLLTKNSFLEELNKPYVLTARSKGLTEAKVLIKHIFRNAMIVIISGFPTIFITLLFTSSLLIEVLFSLDGLGLLGFESTLNRDYTVMFGTLYIFTLLGMFLHLIGDIMYMIVDRRIDITARQG